jgi:two-component system response regulator FixJ
MLAAPLPPVAVEQQTATVFIVDDELPVRKSLRWLIESVGLKAQAFESAAEFLSSFDPQRPGCLVLDIRMPGMSGLDLQERLLERGSKLPVIFVTAHADVPSAVRSMKHGAVNLFEKPVSEQLLLDQIQQCLQQDREQREAAALLAVMSARYNSLTAREAEVLDHVAGGYSSREIGDLLDVSYKTVEAHRAKIMKKMQADSVPDLIRQFLALGLKPATPPVKPAGE